MFIGISLIFFWKVLKEEWLTIGIPGVIASIHALGQLAYFAPKRVPDGKEKEDTTFLFMPFHFSCSVNRN